MASVVVFIPTTDAEDPVVADAGIDFSEGLTDNDKAALEANGGTATFADGVLTIENINFIAKASGELDYALHSRVICEIHIVGTNKISLIDGGSTKTTRYAILVETGLKLTGDGSLEISCCEASEANASVFVKDLGVTGSLIIGDPEEKTSGPTIKAVSDVSTDESTAILCNGSIGVYGSSVIATSDDAKKSYGIHAYHSSMTIKGSDVVATTGIANFGSHGNVAIQCQNEMNIERSTVTAISGGDETTGMGESIGLYGGQVSIKKSDVLATSPGVDTNTFSRYGIISDDDMVIDASTVTAMSGNAKASIAIQVYNEDKSLSIKNGSYVKATAGNALQYGSNGITTDILTIDNSKVECESGSGQMGSFAIYAWKSISISNGSDVTSKGSGNNSYGLMMDDERSPSMSFTTPSSIYLEGEGGAATGKQIDLTTIKGWEGVSVKGTKTIGSPLTEITESDTTGYKIVKITIGMPSYKATFNVDGGSGTAPATQTVEKWKTFTLPNYEGTKTGYKFAGWEYNGFTYPAGSEYVMRNSDMEFKAKWVESKEEKLTVTFNTGGAPGTIDAQTVEKGQKATEPSISWSKHVFVGWYDANGYLWDFNSAVTDSMTLTAHWIEEKPEVSIETDGKGKVEISIPQTSVVKKINVKNGDISLTIPEDSVEKIKVSGRNLYITVTQVNAENEFLVTMKWDDNTDFAGNRTISVPYYSEMGTNPTVYLKEGSTETLMPSTLDASAGVITFDTDHGATFIVRYDDAPMQTNDVNWALLIVFIIAILAVIYVAATTRKE